MAEETSNLESQELVEAKRLVRDSLNGNCRLTIESITDLMRGQLEPDQVKGALESLLKDGSIVESGRRFHDSLTDLSVMPIEILQSRRGDEKLIAEIYAKDMGKDATATLEYCDNKAFFILRDSSGRVVDVYVENDLYGSGQKPFVPFTRDPQPRYWSWVRTIANPK